MARPTINRVNHALFPHKKISKTRTVNNKTKRTPIGKIQLDKLLKSTNPRICIKRRLGGIGDVIMTMPAMKAIKCLIPQAKLIYATDLKYSCGALAEVAKHNPYIDEVISHTEVRDSDYDYITDITATGLSKERPKTVPPNRISLFAEQIGVDIDLDPVPIYEITPKERNIASKELDKLIGVDRKKKKLIAIQTRSNDVRRTWPAKRINELISVLSQDPDINVLLLDWGHSIKFWQTKDTENIFEIYDRSLTETAALIDQCDLVVAPDSSILHLAGALNKRIVSIFGPIPPESRINYYTNAIAVVHKMVCSYCWYSPRCGRNNGERLECLSSITAEEVYNTIKKHIEIPIKERNNINKDKTKKEPIILVKRKTPGLGDLLMVTPAIKGLKARFPSKTIHVAARKEVHSALVNNNNVSKILDVESYIDDRTYEMIIDLSYPCATYESRRVAMKQPVLKSRSEIFAEAAGVRNYIKNLVPSYYPTEEEIAWAYDFLKKSKIDKNKLILTSLSSNEQYRDWPEEYHQELYNLLNNDFQVGIIGKLEGKTYKNVFDIRGFGIRRAMAILSLSKGLVTVDTGPLHFAAALDIPTVSIFGPIDPKARCKGYKNVTVITSDFKCTPCWRNSKMLCRTNGMIKGYSECMKSIKPDKVFEIASKVLRRKNESY